TAKKIAAVRDPQNWILQRKVEYAPLIETPDGRATAEVRVMVFWQEQPVLVNSLVRMSKGKLIGVDFNKDKTWIGASVAFHSPGAQRRRSRRRVSRRPRDPRPPGFSDQSAARPRHGRGVPAGDRQWIPDLR